jgi:hypothetical protein
MLSTGIPVDLVRICCPTEVVSRYSVADISVTVIVFASKLSLRMLILTSLIVEVRGKYMALSQQILRALETQPVHNHDGNSFLRIPLPSTALKLWESC